MDDFNLINKSGYQDQKIVLILFIGFI